jgi:adhesin transport system outer membrane protein
VAALVLPLIFTRSPLFAMPLTEAVSTAVQSNPEIGEAVANREATEFELRQGRGLYLPKLDAEGSIGGEILNNSNTRSDDSVDDVWNPRQGSLVARQLLFDGFATDAEVERQAARVDAASFRVYERSEFIGLSVVKEYLDIVRLQRVVRLSVENEQYHRNLLSKITQGTQGGSVSVADRQQAQERLFAAKARITEAQEDLAAAKTRFIRLVGRDIGKTTSPKSPKALPASVDRAIRLARKSHPSILSARADVDAATALVKGASSAFYPKVRLEGRAFAGEDIDGNEGPDNGLSGNVIVSMNLYNGGIDRANVQEQIRRTDEARMVLHRITREVEEAVRLSWERKVFQDARVAELKRQLDAQNLVVGSYTDQYEIGERSLLDLLDSQNSRYFTEVAYVTSQAASQFANYRILASTGQLLKAMGVKKPPQSQSDARARVGIGSEPPAPLPPRYAPKYDVWGPID